MATMFSKKTAKREALGSRELVAFVATTNVARAREFYGDVLGLRLVSEDAYALVFDANGTKVRIPLVSVLASAPYTVLGWVVPDIEQALRELSARGVTFERIPNIEQDALGVWTAPQGVAKVAWFRDPDGNMLSITQTFAAAAISARMK
jgi:catechol 2,3-dioxygenase-like lactoylglutathione lyase family enzyme